MNRNIIEAMHEEQSYIQDRMKGINNSLLERLTKYGYGELSHYFVDKRDYLFNNWIPEIHYIKVADLTTNLEQAILNKQYGVYISVADGLYAFHGSDDIDYDLCKELGVEVAEMRHKGGTIIGCNGDMGIEIVVPRGMGLDFKFFMSKIFEIISKYVDGAEIVGNDILVNGEKVLGSMTRDVNGVFVWAAQVSFCDHLDVIQQICSKKSTKTPGHIDTSLLTKKKFEEEVLAWLLKR